MSRTTIVVPCYNEAERFDAQAFHLALSEIPGLEFLFVNDGSSDDTLDVLRAFEEKHEDRVRVVDLERNVGKSHAVRAGMLEALEGDATYCGYWDADLATPLDEIPRFVEVLEARPTLDLVMGSRVKLLGRSIERDPLRHYLGRLSATLSSLVLNLPVYDTQCGAKLFRNSTETKSLFAEAFLSGWIFDVEVIARMIRQRRNRGLPSAEFAIYELPLRQWHDMAGSKLQVGSAYMGALWEVARIYWRYMRDQS
jgi:glycosyltransferase involved in cell wall biosynthesis